MGDTKHNSNEETNKRMAKYWTGYWDNIHYMTYRYPASPKKKDFEQVSKFVETLAGTGLNCDLCTHHIRAYLKQHPLTFEKTTNGGLFRYFIDLHNDINKQQNKSTVSYKVVYDRYASASMDAYVKTYGVDIMQLYAAGRVEDFIPQYNALFAQV